MRNWRQCIWSFSRQQHRLKVLFPVTQWCWKACVGVVLTGKILFYLRIMIDMSLDDFLLAMNMTCKNRRSLKFERSVKLNFWITFIFMKSFARSNCSFKAIKWRKNRSNRRFIRHVNEFLDLKIDVFEDDLCSQFELYFVKNGLYQSF